MPWRTESLLLPSVRRSGGFGYPGTEISRSRGAFLFSQVSVYLEPENEEGKETPEFGVADLTESKLYFLQCDLLLGKYVFTIRAFFHGI